MHQVSYVFNTVDIRFMSASVSGCSREGGGGISARGGSLLPRRQ